MWMWMDMIYSVWDSADVGTETHAKAWCFSFTSPKREEKAILKAKFGCKKL